MTRPPISDADLLAYVDGRLEPARAAAIEAAVAADAATRAEAEAYRAQNRLVREAAEALAPATVDLRTAALERALAQRLAQRRRLPSAGFARIAAGLALFAAGWLAHAWWPGGNDPLPGYVAEARGAHRVFALDHTRPVEFTRAESEDAVAWLSAKLGQPIAVPALDAHGLDLLGARLHGTREGPLVQFIYEDAAGRRLSLFVARPAEHAPPAAYAETERTGEAIGYWSDTTLDYALVAPASEAPLAPLATTIAQAMPR